MHFLERKWIYVYFAQDLMDVCSEGSNEQYFSIGSDNILAPTRRQAIIWTNYVLFFWLIYAPLGLNDLFSWECIQYVSFGKLIQ